MKRATRKIEHKTTRLPESVGEKTLGPGELETAILFSCWSCTVGVAKEKHPSIGRYICDDCWQDFDERIA